VLAFFCLVSAVHVFDSVPLGLIIFVFDYVRGFIDLCDYVRWVDSYLRLCAYSYLYVFDYVRWVYSYLYVFDYVA
jgi:hypothetical protein